MTVYFIQRRAKPELDMLSPEIPDLTDPSMRLPNADRAFVDLQKLREYCLNPAHPRGQHKARVFASALGITAREAAWLRTAFLRAACTHDATAGEADAMVGAIIWIAQLTVQREPRQSEPPGSSEPEKTSPGSPAARSCDRSGAPHDPTH